MASKGQKFKKFAPDLKAAILYEYLSGTSSLFLSKKYGVSAKTIRDWKRKHLKGIDITVDRWKGNSGRPRSRNLTLEDYKERYEILKKYQAFLEARQGKK